MKYIIALDAGTTSSRAVLYDSQGQVCAISQLPFDQHFPHPGWVEHDPFDILGSQLEVMRRVMAQRNLSAADIAAIGITNQRETTMLWNRSTGMPYANAIVWQCRRTADIVEDLFGAPHLRERVVEITGLVPDAYFSASKVKWFLDHVPGIREDMARGEVMFGTVDTWLIYNLTGGAVHATDYTNASRTMLFDIRKGQWDPWLCSLVGADSSLLPRVLPSSGSFGQTAECAPAARILREQAHLSDTHAWAAESFPAGIPICGVAGDQQASLFGHCCTHPGQAKNTYGTGCFMLMHTGEEAIRSHNKLLTTIAASLPGTPQLEYALEGSVFVAGALVQWLRDSLGFIKTADESEEVALSVPDSAGVYVVPSFTGLGAPYWDANARGAIIGLTRGVTPAHIVRASLEAMAYQVTDLINGMAEDAGFIVQGLDVDGGACRNNFLMQFQADILGLRLERPADIEVTAAGAAYLAGLGCGYWENLDQIQEFRSIERTFLPGLDDRKRFALIRGWADAIGRVRTR